MPQAAGQRTEASGRPPDPLPIVIAEPVLRRVAIYGTAHRLVLAGHQPVGRSPVLVGVCLGLVTIGCICFVIGVARTAAAGSLTVVPLCYR